MELLTLFLVCVFSIVQSMFGLGLLVFGTPSLLLSGMSYNDVLSTLLPPSTVISAIQYMKMRNDYPADIVIKNHIFGKSVLLLCVPFISLSLFFRNHFDGNLNLILIGALLLGAVSIFSVRIANAMIRIIKNSTSVYLIAMGFVHGLSNMGGTLLSPYASTMHSDKISMRSCVVTGYLIFGVSQLIILTALGELNIGFSTVLYCVFAAAAHLTLGSKIYTSIGERFYRVLVALFMFTYALLLILKNILEL